MFSNLKKCLVILITLLSFQGFANNVQDVDENPPALGDQVEIATDSSGMLVYAIWRKSFEKCEKQPALNRFEEFLKSKTPVDPPKSTQPIVPAIQIAISTDGGQTWKNPTSTPTGIIPDLATSGEAPQITTDSSGQYVYAVWKETDENLLKAPVLNRYEKYKKSLQPVNRHELLLKSKQSEIEGTIQVAISQDYGENWTSPISTPTNNTPDISLAGRIPQIITDSSGRYVYAIWDGSNRGGGPIQVAISQDFGSNWIDPTSTPTGVIPDLAYYGNTPIIKTDIIGVYALWLGAENKVCAAISEDHGETWIAK